MQWRFTIIDRNDVATVIEEPTGWDKLSLELARHPDYHGIFLNIQGDDSLEFDGIARKLLKEEYEQYGSEGQMTLLIEQSCRAKRKIVDNIIDTENSRHLHTEDEEFIITEEGKLGQELVWEEFDRGQFNFNLYDELCGDICVIKIPVENTDETMLLRNRMNQKVNLETITAFDETTALDPYSNLPLQLKMPSKGIVLKDKFLNNLINATPVAGVPVAGAPGATVNAEFGMIEIGMNTTVATEIGNSGMNVQPLYQCIFTQDATPAGCSSLNKFQPDGTYYISPLDISSVINYQEGTPNYGQVSDVLNVNIDIKGSITFRNANQALIRFMVLTLPAGNAGDLAGDYIYHSNQLIYGTVSGSSAVTTDQVVSIDASYSNASFILNKGDRVFVFYAIYHRVNNADNNGHAFDLQFDPDCIVDFSTLSHVADTFSACYMVNEAVSRVTEAITNDSVRAFSEYFGRLDSQPYSQTEDGCGSLEVITDGLRVRRQENKTPGKTTPFAVSLQDLFDGLNPIHNIGMGLEPDPNRTGKNRLRVERWEYFFNDAVVMSCTNINLIKKTVATKDVFSTCQFGYAKWEAEEYNGLDEFLTKRNFRTTLSRVKNDFIKLSKFVGSGYAYEVTRRKGNEGSKDWRYDKDTFILCCKRGITLENVWILANLSDPSHGLIIKIEPPAYNPGLVQQFLDRIFAVGQVLQISNGTYDLGTLTVTAVTTYGFSNGGVVVTFAETINPIWAIGIGSGLFDVTNDNFISVEQGNVTSADNIVDPDTIINYRISPVRNALRWMNRVTESYRQFDDESKIICTDGEGNVFAEGQMTDDTCRLEGDVIAENATISRTVFEDPNAAKPFRRPERIEFDYPLSAMEYKAIKANPFGLVFYSSDCLEGYGYIDSIKYKPEEGSAVFKLIPKIEAP